MIKPSIGRVVWFYPDGMKEGVQPNAASIAFVYSDTLVNLGYFNKHGIACGATSVRLVQDDETVPDGLKYFCCWMPYQVGQAKKTEALEEALSKR